MEQPHVNTMSFTDEELAILNKVVREHKVSATMEELVMLQLGKSTSPLIGLTIKIATEFEKRQAAVTEEAAKQKSESAAKDE